MTAYYNEHEPYAAQWLRNLIAAGHIAAGDVDVRDIQDVTPDDLTGYTQCHFFAGIGGFSYALRLAGWPDDRPVWTGSCPCQPFSAAGKRAGADDPRHLWPSWVRLIRECRPVTAIGEQVASAITHGWLDGVSADLEAEGYTVGAVVLGAHSVGAPHIRQRLWWVAERLGVSDRPGRRSRIVAPAAARHGDPAESTSRAGGLADTEAARSPHRGARPVQPEPGEGRGADGGLADAEHAERRTFDSACGAARPDSRGPEDRQEGAGRTRSGGEDGGLGDADPARSQGRGERPDEHADQRAPWSSSELLPCADGRARRIPQSGIFPLAHGISGRVGQLRAYGNAICPQVAAVFIRAYQDVRHHA